MEKLRKIQWLGWAINVLAATLFLFAIASLHNPYRHPAMIVASVLIFVGPTMKLPGALQERKAKTLI